MTTIKMEPVIIRPIAQQDDAALATIIRSSLEEFKANKAGTVYFDESTDHLSKIFIAERSAYFTALIDAVVAGGGGIFPTQNLPGDTCELVKMYLAPAARGKGIGKMLMQQCLDTAAKLGYKKVYLETMPELTNAIPMYEKFGFTYLPSSLGNSGHCGCDVWMMKSI
jgi:putative acetyltransferase